MLGPLVIKDLSAASNATLVGSLPGSEYLNCQQLNLKFSKHVCLNRKSVAAEHVKEKSLSE